MELYLRKLQKYILNTRPVLLKALILTLLPGFFFLTLLATTGRLCLPGQPVFSLFVLLLSCVLVGSLLEHLGFPGMIGMLLIGIGMSNIPVIKDATVLQPDSISQDIKNVCLIVILMRGGLSLDIMDIKKCSGAVIRLIFMPCFTEAAVFAVLSVYLLKMGWLDGFMLGFVVAAVTPAIIVPALIRLQNKGFQLSEKNIDTMLISASSFDDVVAISSFMVFLSSWLLADKSLVYQVLKGPLEIVIGMAIGIFSAMLLSIITPPALALEKRTNLDSYFRISRAFFMIMFAVIAVFGLNYLDFSGSGPLAVIVMSIVVRKGCCEEKYISGVLDKVWLYAAEPLLFGLVGRDIQLSLITVELLWKSLVVIITGLLFRSLAAYTAASWTHLSVRERIFISVSWLPKATVQAAIGSYALSTVREKGITDGDVIRSCEIIVTVAVLVILVSAPLGSLLMKFGASHLLLKNTGDYDAVQSELQDIPTEIKKI